MQPKATTSHPRGKRVSLLCTPLRAPALTPPAELWSPRSAWHPRGGRALWAEPVVAGVTDGTVTGHPLALPLVKGMEPVRVLSALPLPSAQVSPLFKLIPQVVPVRLGALRAQSQPH